MIILSRSLNMQLKISLYQNLTYKHNLYCKRLNNSSFWLSKIYYENEYQWNQLMVPYTSEQSGVSPSTEFKAIAAVNIDATASAGDPILVFVSSNQNVTYGVTGLVATNFRVVNTATDAVIPITTSAPGINPGNYVLTPTTPLVAAQTITVQTWDGTNFVGVAVLADGKLIEGISV